ncbi:Protein-L-isoaspartate O-methyltransferase domain-containing protein 1 [Perkinsus olseni]|uniref:protein-L-isoaspartate(D-aspartate) O-methyltransferase n=1 Tax=Perkinsus olseni TaxID=32597 RepID=A0A7J6S7D9_PEROL|nr:Protein-L-isoaspartate O-methyltransferase domain-containing protein 1 [Perkinsus olseni]
MLGYGIRASTQGELIEQLKQRGFIRNSKVSEAMSQWAKKGLGNPRVMLVALGGSAYHFIVDRARFLPRGATDPYGNTPVKVSEGSSISTPQLHAQVLQLLSPALDSDAAPRSFLDFGCGTGYLASVAAEMGIDRVIASECDTTAYQAAQDNLAGYGAVRVLRLFPQDSYSTAKFTALYASPYFPSEEEALKFCSQWLHDAGLAVCSYCDCPDAIDQRLILIRKKADGSMEVTPQFRVAGGPLKREGPDENSRQTASTDAETRELNKRLLLGWRERFETKYGRRPTRADMFGDPAAAEAFRQFSGTS